MHLHTTPLIFPLLLAASMLWEPWTTRDCQLRPVSSPRRLFGKTTLAQLAHDTEAHHTEAHEHRAQQYSATQQYNPRAIVPNCRAIAYGCDTPVR